MKINLFKHFFVVALVLAFAMTSVSMSHTTVAQSDSPLSGVDITSGRASWGSAIPVVAVFEVLLETLGAEVTVTDFASNPIAYQALANGDIDYWPNGWFPLHNPQLPDNFSDVATIFDPHCQACGLQGYLVNVEAVEEFNITSLQDFTRPEVRAAFDENGDGRADLFGCPPGWGCHEVINFHLEAFGLEDHINHGTAAYAANFANAQARIQAGQPALFYTWTPNDTILQLIPGEDVVWINLVDDAASLQNSPSQEGFDSSALIANGLGATAVTDPTNLGFVAADIDVAANNAFLAANPAVSELFNQVSLPLGWISEATKAIGDNGLTDEDEFRQLAEDFIADNQELVDGWLSAARNAQ